MAWPAEPAGSCKRARTRTRLATPTPPGPSCGTPRAASATGLLAAPERGANDERGSVLILVPAAILVLLILGSIAVDYSIAYLGQRELRYEAAAVANDAAGAAISLKTFYQGDGSGSAPGRVVISSAKVGRVLDQSLATRPLRGVEITGHDFRVNGNQICVTLYGHVSYIFARAFPFARHGVDVVGRSSATAVAGPAGTTVPPDRSCH